VPLAVPTALLLRHGRRERRRLADELAQRSGIETELRRLAAADDLTGLHNRRFLTEFGAVMVDGAQRQRLAAALLLVDLDGFKGVNDRFGHRVGDEVLRAFADHLRRTLRAADVVARLGGDEFAAMLPETDPAGALRAAERIRARALDLPQLLGVTVSIGVATPAGPGARLETLLETADRALYEAKRLGRNRVVAAAAVQRPGPAETLEGRQTV
jgi:diguanylate cyclase (GGDEF)-like protein